MSTPAKTDCTLLRIITAHRLIPKGERQWRVPEKPAQMPNTKKTSCVLRPTAMATATVVTGRSLLDDGWRRSNCLFPSSISEPFGL